MIYSVDLEYETAMAGRYHSANVDVYLPTGYDPSSEIRVALAARFGESVRIVGFADAAVGRAPVILDTYYRGMR